MSGCVGIPARIEPEQGHEWVMSDGKILSRMTINGNDLSVTMPWGKTITAQVQKMNMQAAQSFCEFVRGSYREWQEEKAAASAARHAELASERAAEREADEESNEVFEAGVELNFLDPEAVAARCAALGSRLGDIQAEARAIDKELTKLYKILEVLNDIDEREVPAQTTEGLSPAEEVEQDEVVDSGPREQELQSGGPAEAGKDAPAPVEEQLDNEDGNSRG
jgi:hypothetical protein